MIITDLNYLETVAENCDVVGGYLPRFAFADSYAYAGASGKYFAATVTVTYTNASTRRGHAAAVSGSISKSAAS